MRGRRRTYPAALAAAALVLGASACGSGGAPRPSPAPAPAAPQGPAPGITEDNAQLLRSPGSAPDDAFAQARRELTALRPTYVRLLIDWAALAPAPGRAPLLSAPVSGCARQVAPCGAYAGVQGELAAIASQQRAAGNHDGSADAAAPGEPPFQIVVDFLGVPRWASAPVGCAEGAGGGSRLELSPAALASYRSLVDGLVALARAQGVALNWWSPWNEPNDARFLAPQRAGCEAGSAPLSPAIYAELARAMASELRARDPGAALVLGELNGIGSDSPHATSVASFVAALPADVLCLASAWSVHAYATYGPASSATEPVAALERALDARGGCAAQAPVWVTEAGAGAPHPGEARPASVRDETEGCRALAAQLARWAGDPRVAAVFQYSFREDPAYPVGLVSADLKRAYPAYRLWLSYGRRRAAGQSPAPGAAGAAAACAP